LGPITTGVWIQGHKQEEQPQSIASLMLHVYFTSGFRIMFYCNKILSAFLWMQHNCKESSLTALVFKDDMDQYTP
jgi:hypothetical protein